MYTMYWTHVKMRERTAKKNKNKCGVTTSNIIYIPTSIRLTPFQLRATTFSCILEHARHETNVYYKSLAFNYVIETSFFSCPVSSTTAYHKVSIIIVICDCAWLWGVRDFVGCRKLCWHAIMNECEGVWKIPGPYAYSNTLKHTWKTNKQTNKHSNTHEKHCTRVKQTLKHTWKTLHTP